jgi:hypothetical protein
VSTLTRPSGREGLHPKMSRVPAKTASKKRRKKEKKKKKRKKLVERELTGENASIQEGVGDVAQLGATQDHCMFQSKKRDITKIIQRP